MGLKAVGKVATRNGEVLAPTFPDTPAQIVDRIPGLVAIVDAENHNTYEDLPVVGVAYQGCYERAQRNDAHAYRSVVTPDGTAANRNLQGFDSLKHVRRDCIAVLEDMGFGVGVRPGTISNTGINYNAVKVVSNILSKSETFKLAEVDIFSIPNTGSLGQIIQTVPTAETIDAGLRASEAEVTAQSYAMGTSTQIGISEVYGLNAWKGTSEAHPWESWSAITWTANHPPPPDYVENKNAMRDLPARFTNRVFYTGMINLQDQRKMVVSRLAKHPS